MSCWPASTTNQSGLVTFDLLTLKVVSESRVTWATSVPILIFLGLSVLELGPMYATDRQTSDSIIIIIIKSYYGAPQPVLRSASQHKLRLKEA